MVALCGDFNPKGSECTRGVGGVRFGLAQSRLSMPPTMGTLAGLQLVMLVSVRRSRSFCLVLTDVVNVVEVVVGLRSLGVMLL